MDTAFFQLTDVPAVEVTGGCFCCNYDDLDSRLDQLRMTINPDVIFAESVGSCADIVATVVKPLLQLRRGEISPTSFSVFADARLLRRRLLGQPLPFSENVVYLFDKQLEEAGLLVINKADLLTAEMAEDTLARAQRRFHDKAVRLQNSLDEESLMEWITLVESSALVLPTQSLEIDYERYGNGEMQLAWLDTRIILDVPSGKGRGITIQLVEGIVGALKDQKLAVGHLKFLIHEEPLAKPDVASVKLSFPTLDVSGWQDTIPALTGSKVTILVNARVEARSDELRDLVRQTVSEVVARAGMRYGESGTAYFHPSFPSPTHRVG